MEAANQLVNKLSERNSCCGLYRKFVVDEVAEGEGAVSEHISIAVLHHYVVHVFEEEFQELVQTMFYVDF